VVLLAQGERIHERIRERICEHIRERIREAILADERRSTEDNWYSKGLIFLISFKHPFQFQFQF
jgi:hypothetical protein